MTTDNVRSVREDNTMTSPRRDDRVRRVMREAQAIFDPNESASSDELSEMVIRDPAPDASPSREPSGTYRIVKVAF